MVTLKSKLREHVLVSPTASIAAVSGVMRSEPVLWCRSRLGRSVPVPRPRKSRVGI